MMGSYDELRRLRTEIEDAQHVIREKRARRARLYSMLTSGHAPIDGMPVGGNSTMEDKLVNMAALSREIDEAVDHLAWLQAKTEAICSRALHGPGRRVLVMRYVDGRSWNEIRRAMYYSERAVFYLHRKAIAEIDDSDQG